MSLIVLGNGEWGKKLVSNIKKKRKIKKIINSKQNFRNQNYDDITHVFIATPNKFHYSQVLFFLKKKITIFCEKPLSLSFKNSLKLINLSKKKRTKLFIDDIEIYKNTKIKIRKNNFITRGKLKKNYSMNDVLYAWAYHDFYILEKYINIKKMKIKILKNSPFEKEFKIESNNKYFNFKYFLNKKVNHCINNKNLQTSKNFIPVMLKFFFSNKLEAFKKNNARALYCSYIIDKIKDKVIRNKL